MRINILTVLLLASSNIVNAQTEVPGMVDIPAGYFWMGSSGWGHDYNEAPVHKVNFRQGFRMSATEITNSQFEEFMPKHRSSRGQGGFSYGDNEAVTNVSYHDATAYCEWLSEKTGRSFRLPTEAEWEYACRAGTYTLYYTGDGLPESMMKNQKTERDLVSLSLEVGQSEPNAFGLFDMHGNVEEWCMDWYGPYTSEDQTDPAGHVSGLFRVTRGGSHNTPSEFLRSANRSAAIPADRHSQIGFRIVESEMELSYLDEKNRTAGKISQRKHSWKEKGKDAFWAPPVPYIIKPSDNTPYYRHHHQPAVTWCDNGDLLAIWFSCDAESGREMVMLSSRLKKGQSEWTEAELFFKVPDRNMTG